MKQSQQDDLFPKLVDTMRRIQAIVNYGPIDEEDRIAIKILSTRALPPGTRSLLT